MDRRDKKRQNGTAKKSGSRIPQAVARTVQKG